MPLTYPAGTVDSITRDNLRRVTLIENGDGSWTTWTDLDLVDTDGNIRERRERHRLVVSDQPTVDAIVNLVDTVHIPKLEADVGI